MEISIIIPTLNEEKCLPKLLESIKIQSFKDYEIIVADAGSTDNTIKIVKKYNAYIVQGGMPAVGRNAGAKIAKGNFLFFFDADTRLPINFIENTYNELKKRNLSLATCKFKPISNLFIDKVLHNFANLSVKVTQFSNPHAPGFCILVKKSLFKKVSGFNEKLKLAEDHDFVKRASKFSPLRVLISVKILVSIRRLKKEGRFILMGKYVRVEFHRMFKGELDKEMIKYEFANFDKKDNSNLNIRLRKIEKQINNLNKKYSLFEKKYLKNKAFTKDYKEAIRIIEKKLENIKVSIKSIIKF